MNKRQWIFQHRLNRCKGALAVEALRSEFDSELFVPEPEMGPGHYRRVIAGEHAERVLNQPALRAQIEAEIAPLLAARQAADAWIVRRFTGDECRFV